MAKDHPLERISYERVSHMCALTACDTHILGHTLWAQPPSSVVVAGLLIGARQYHCSQSPCIVDDTGKNPKIWYLGINNDTPIAIVWLVEHACTLYRVGKRVEYYEWPIKPRLLTLYDARAIEYHLTNYTTNSMAAACMKSKAIDWLTHQLCLTESEVGWSVSVDLTKNPLLTMSEEEQ